MNRIAVLTLLAVIALSAPAHQTKAPQKKGAPPKNLQVLSPDANVVVLMQSFETALGITECTYCHVQGDFASDMNPNKVTARRMIRMVRDINTKFPDGMKHVNCWTCHRGDHGKKPDYPAGTDPELAP
jgi:hypothetical protein